MRALAKAGFRVLISAAVALAVSWFYPAWAGSSLPDNRVTISQLDNENYKDEVQVLFAEMVLAGTGRWQPATTNTILGPSDQLKSGPHTRGVLKWTDHSTFRFGPNTHLKILPPSTPGAEDGLQFFSGLLSFFHRDKPSHLRILMQGKEAGVDGTEFVLAVDTVGNVERATLSVIDGRVRLTSGQVSQTVTNLQQAIAFEGQPPLLLPGFIIANDVLQWVLYYPAVLDPAEIPFTAAEQQALAGSLSAYRAGDVHQALRAFPAAPLTSDAQRVYYAALLLAAGEVQESQGFLAALPPGDPTGRLQRLASALRQLIAAVKIVPAVASPEPILASEFLAASYYAQSRGVGKEPLAPALEFAHRAETISPSFGYAAARVADLQFSFGRIDPALDALNRSLLLAPRNAQAYATRGFLLAAQNKIGEAIDSFNQSIALDGALGNAWLGRGLAIIKRNHVKEGQEDLLVAAALEPQRAFFRSYLGKAYADTGDTARATKELGLAMRLDPGDPTAWLYSALLNQQDNRINQAIHDLEHSKDLNNNRNLYRSSLELDQDLAVRSANLAAIYHDAGMDDVAMREAAVAVNADYANYSGHLFLANSYDQLRDPKQINLRYETATFGEYLIANLLAPVGAGTLSQTISEQEYAKLFERDRLGVASTTEYFSNGAWRENGAQFGTFGTTSYSLEALYLTDPGYRPNNDFEQRTLSLQLKQQLTVHDTVYLQALDYEATGGDLLQYFDPTQANFQIRFKEREEPLLFGGYHREWSPGVHTLVLAGWLNDTISVSNPKEPANLIATHAGSVLNVVPFAVAQEYEQTANIFTSEIQQILEGVEHTTIVGARFQTGDFDVQNRQHNPSFINPFFRPDPEHPMPPPEDLQIASQDLTLNFQRLAFYGYHSWSILDSLQLTAGLSYDRITFPSDFRFGPVSDAEQTKDQVSPKAGVIWTPLAGTTIRAAYTKSLGGASLDQSVRLEPSQVAGFNQAFRGIIPESVAAANAGATFESYSFSLEQKLRTGTYFGLVGEVLNSDVDRTLGVFASEAGAPPTLSSIRDSLNYQERSLVLSLDQLVGNFWSFGVRYHLTDASLQEQFPGVPADVYSFPERRGTLNQVDLHALCNLPSGFFAEFQALWNQQRNHTDNSPLNGDDFWQLNLFAGYRFPRRKAQLTVGLLNLADHDYRLDPLTLYNELPHERTFMARLGFNF